MATRKDNTLNKTIVKIIIISIILIITHKLAFNLGKAFDQTNGIRAQVEVFGQLGDMCRKEYIDVVKHLRIENQTSGFKYRTIASPLELLWALIAY